MNICFLTDDYSASKDLFKKYIASKEPFSYTYGEIPTASNATEEEIIRKLESIIHDVDYIVAISSSGNGIAIYANKIQGFNAASINTEEDVDIAIDSFSANAFDIPCYSKALNALIDKVLYRIGE